MAALQTAAVLLAAVAIMFVATFTGASAQAPAMSPESVSMGPSAAMAPASDCMTNLLNMSDCLSYVQAGSTSAKPDKACCPELAGLVESRPDCLCLLLNKNATEGYGISIDMKRALKLPSVCGVSTPPLSLCSAILGAPVGSPAASEASVAPAGGAPEGLAASPAGGANGSGASNNGAISSAACLVALAVALVPTFL